MAIFEKTSHTKALVDDTEILTCTIENSQTVRKHTEYTLRVSRGILRDTTWTVSRRYKDFVELHAALAPSGYDLPLPPKKYFGNLDPSFIAERQIALQNYLNEILRHDELALSRQVRSFLDPHNYSSNAAELALQTVSIALRGEGRFELKGAIADIGWRIRKYNFLVTDTKTQENCILSWQNFGPDRYLNDKKLQAALKSLQNLSHPHIDQILAFQNLDTGVYVVRSIYEGGSLRDMIYQTEYSGSHLAKYSNPKNIRPFVEEQIYDYGRQILEALKFLHDKGLPHGHVHPGNIMVVQHHVYLTDIENILLGGPSLYRQYLLQLRPSYSADNVDAHCFGRVLYEMTFGRPLAHCYCDTYPDYLSEELKSLLRIILSRDACRSMPPTLSYLLLLPVFKKYPVRCKEERATLKFPLALKEELRAAVDHIEDKLKKDQKKMRSAKREVRIQEILNSEDEMKKQKRKVKRRESHWQSMSSIPDMYISASVSDASSPTPPTTGAICASTPDSPQTYDARRSLLDAICNFDKSSLATQNNSDSR
ncbi:PX domain-containing protein kinase-like protein [Trichoplusia ni]|uniref:PX domain-containing protein kinase-like protein n=1 Tax=Trichoplusia ni TaxID=7111 RepID=A0A7E5WKD4_TRINI|nr:PX domain-containing protein kinase-like protein [Trichoplusia ni]